MTPAEFIALNPSACQAGKDCIVRFPTMRDWWMSPDCRVSWMLWALGRDDANKQGIVAFAKWCADGAKRFAAYAAAADAYATAAAAYADAYAAAAAAAAAYSAAYAADSAYADADATAAAARWSAAKVRNSQREKLREIFPDMFNNKKETT